MKKATVILEKEINAWIKAFLQGYPEVKEFDLYLTKKTSPEGNIVEITTKIDVK